MLNNPWTDGIFTFQTEWLEFIITSEEVSCWSFVAVYKISSDVSDLCHEIAITWLLGPSAFDDLVISCHYRMVCINLGQCSSLWDLVHQNWARVVQLVENQGSGIQPRQNYTLSLFWGQFCMEKLYGKFVRCIINDFLSSYKLQILFCLSLHNMWVNPVQAWNTTHHSCHNHTINFVMFML